MVSTGSVGGRVAVARCGFGRGFGGATAAGAGGGGSWVIDACSGTVSGGASVSVGQNEKAACTAIDKASPAIRPRRGACATTARINAGVAGGCVEAAIASMGNGEAGRDGVRCRATALRARRRGQVHL